MLSRLGCTRQASSLSLSSTVRSNVCVLITLPDACSFASCDSGGLLHEILLFGIAARHSGPWGLMHGLQMQETHLLQNR